jgi:Niemann-Pick C1 protein
MPEWFAFLGEKVPPGFPGSPYSIQFKTTIPDSSPMKPMNASVYSCNDTSLGCSCGDCPSSPVCSDPEPSPPRKDPCSIGVGSLKVETIKLIIFYD